MKTCPKCKKNLPQKQYYKRRDCITSTYCVDCTSKKNVDKEKRKMDIVNEVTNNGECWWVHQYILGNKHFYRKKRR